jgi:tRNA(fMet)-specific endonuclease VapC
VHLLDTDTITHLHAGYSGVVERLQTVDDPDVGATIITKVEILRGRYDYLLKASTSAEILRARELLLRTEELLSPIPTVPFDDVAATIFDRLRGAKGLRKIGNADLLIASIVLSRRATLVTRNLRHFRAIPGMQVVNRADGRPKSEAT